MRKDWRSGSTTGPTSGELRHTTFWQKHQIWTTALNVQCESTSANEVRRMWAKGHQGEIGGSSIPLGVLMIITANLIALLALGQSAAPAASASESANEIIDRMVVADDQRLAKLAGYTGMRKYHLENQRFHKTAGMTVRVDFDPAGTKKFEVVAEEGSKVIRHRVLQPMLDAESEGSRKGDRERSRIIPKNYDFKLIGADTSSGSKNYVFEISPKTQNKFLMRGKIWVDAKDYAVTQVEGTPAKNPSFWTRNIHIAHHYGKVGAFWLPLLNSSSADALIFGRTSVTIEYSDYVVREARHAGGGDQQIGRSPQ